MRRKATFIGSDEWRKRDVSHTFDIHLSGLNRLLDKPSGIFVQSATLSLDVLAADLAHRVTQLTF